MANRTYKCKNRSCGHKTKSGGKCKRCLGPTRLNKTTGKWKGCLWHVGSKSKSKSPLLKKSLSPGPWKCSSSRSSSALYNIKTPPCNIVDIGNKYLNDLHLYEAQLEKARCARNKFKIATKCKRINSGGSNSKSRSKSKSKSFVPLSPGTVFNLAGRQLYDYEDKLAEFQARQCKTKKLSRSRSATFDHCSPFNSEVFKQLS